MSLYFESLDAVSRDTPSAWARARRPDDIRFVPSPRPATAIEVEKPRTGLKPLTKAERKARSELARSMRAEEKARQQRSEAMRLAKAKKRYRKPTVSSGSIFHHLERLVKSGVVMEGACSECDFSGYKPDPQQQGVIGHPSPGSPAFPSTTREAFGFYPWSHGLGAFVRCGCIA